MTCRRWCGQAKMRDKPDLLGRVTAQKVATPSDRRSHEEQAGCREVTQQVTVDGSADRSLGYWH